MILLLKAQVAGYHRADGTYVSPHLRRAVAYGTKKHAGQLRKDGKTPYITHPLAVATILHDEAGVRDDGMLQAAVLHDTMEDCGVTRDDLEREFGADVALLVHELTNEPSVPGLSKRDAQSAKIRKISARAAQLKIADKIANIRDLVAAPPTDWDAARKRRYFDDARAVVQAVGDQHPILSRLFSLAYLTGIDRI